MEPRRHEQTFDGYGIRTDPSESTLPLNCFKKFVSTLDSQFSELIRLQRQTFLDMLEKQEDRRIQIDTMMKQRIEFDQENTILQFKNQELREFLSQRNNLRH